MCTKAKNNYRQEMIQRLLSESGLNISVPGQPEEQEALIRRLMTVTLPTTLDQDYYKLEKLFLEEYGQGSGVVDVSNIGDPISDKLYLYQGDITLIKADAIVNAANEKMLGCFIPGHACIDNAIQMAAGLGLRQELLEIMSKQHHDEPVGQAKITSGYHLPSKYVIHTVGPNVYDGVEKTWEDVRNQLKACYISVLETARTKGDIKTLVFCSISTGVYGVPIEMASEVAVTTIQDYIQQHPQSFSRIVIDVFSQRDYEVYASLI